MSGKQTEGTLPDGFTAAWPTGKRGQCLSANPQTNVWCSPTQRSCSQGKGRGLINAELWMNLRTQCRKKPQTRNVTLCHIPWGLCAGKIQNRWIHRNKEKADWGLPEPRGQEDGGCFTGMKILRRIMRLSMLVHTCHLRTQEEAKAGGLRFKTSLRHLGRPCLKNWVDKLIQYLPSEDWMVGKHLSLLPVIRPFVSIRAEFWIYNMT